MGTLSTPGVELPLREGLTEDKWQRRSLTLGGALAH